MDRHYPSPRRVFLRGLAALPVAVTAGGAAVAAPSANDLRLVALAEAYEALESRCAAHTAAHRHLRGRAAAAAAEEFDLLAGGYSLMEEECRDTPADTMVGVLAKARLCQCVTARAFPTHEHIVSTVDDLHRLFGGLNA